MLYFTYKKRGYFEGIKRMTLLDKIAEIKRAITLYTVQINACSKTTAGQILKREIVIDRNEQYYRLGKLCANKGVKICLQSQFTS